MASHASPVRPYRGVPAAERAARRRAALLEAALETLGTQGWSTATMRGVCRMAGLNDRYFYESFSGMDALLLAVVDEQAAQGTAVIMAAAREAPRRLRPRTRAVVSAILDFLAADPRRARILAQEFPANPLLQQRRREIIETLTTIFVTQAYEVLDEIPVSPIDLELTALTVVAGLWEVITTWLQGGLDTDRGHLIDYMVALLSATTDLATTLQQRLA